MNAIEEMNKYLHCIPGVKFTFTCDGSKPYLKSRPENSTSKKMYEYIYQIFELCRFFRPIHISLTQKSIRGIQRMDSTFKNLHGKSAKDSNARKQESMSDEGRVQVTYCSNLETTSTQARLENRKTMGKMCEKIVTVGKGKEGGERKSRGGVRSRDLNSKTVKSRRREIEKGKSAEVKEKEGGEERSFRVEVMENERNIEESKLIFGDREKIRRVLILRDIQFNEADWLKCQHKLQEVVIEYFVEKLKTRHQFQSMNSQKQLLLKQQLKIAEDIKNILLLQAPSNKKHDISDQRKEQIKDFAQSLYQKHTFKQFLVAAELKLTSSSESVLNKLYLYNKKEELEKELKLIKTLLDIQ